MADSPVLSSTPTSVNSPTPVPPLSPSTVSTSSITPTSSATTAPTIPVGSITSTPQANLPSTTTSSGDKPANAVIGGAPGIMNGLSVDQSAMLSTAQDSENQTQAQYDKDRGSITNLIGQYLGKGSDQLQMEQNAGIPGLRQVAAQLNTQYSTQQLAYNAQYNSILNNPMGTMEQKAQQISALQQQHGFELADTSIKAALANTNYTAAQEVINHQIDIKYAPLKDAIDFGQKFLDQDQALLTQKESQKFQASLAVQKQVYDQGIYFSHLLADTKVQMIKDAQANKAPASVMQSIWDATDIGSAAKAGGEYLANGSYDFKLDPGTGEYKSYNTKTGQFIDGTSATGGSPVQVSGHVVTTPSGKTYDLSTYAADPAYATKIGATMSQIVKDYGGVYDPKTAQMVIDRYAPGSKLTGDMVYQAATNAGVDPTLFMAQLQLECQLGCSNVALKDNNYGGVTYVGQANATKGSARPEGGNYAHFKTPQDGLASQAHEDARRQATGPTATTSTGGTGLGASDQKAQATISAMPKLVQPAALTAPGGAVAIDMSKVPPELQISAQNFAAAHPEVKVLNGDQAEVLRGIIQAQKNITDVLGPAWTKIAPKNWVDMQTKQAFSNVAKVKDTDFYSQNKTFLQNQEAIAQQVKSLSESAAKVGLIDVAHTALPTNAGYMGRGGDYDTLKQGNDKLQRSLDYLNTAMQKLVPSATPVSLTNVSSAGTVTMTSPNGKAYTVPKDKISVFLQNGYSQQ